MPLIKDQWGGKTPPHQPAQISARCPRGRTVFPPLGERVQVKFIPFEGVEIDSTPFFIVNRRKIAPVDKGGRHYLHPRLIFSTGDRPRGSWNGFNPLREWVNESFTLRTRRQKRLRVNLPAKLWAGQGGVETDSTPRERVSILWTPLKFKESPNFGSRCSLWRFCGPLNRGTQKRGCWPTRWGGIPPPHLFCSVNTSCQKF